MEFGLDQLRTSLRPGSSNLDIGAKPVKNQTYNFMLYLTKYRKIDWVHVRMAKNQYWLTSSSCTHCLSCMKLRIDIPNTVNFSLFASCMEVFNCIQKGLPWNTLEGHSRASEMCCVGCQTVLTYCFNRLTFWKLRIKRLIFSIVAIIKFTAKGNLAHMNRKQIGQVIWQKGRIAAAHGRLSGIRQAVPVCTAPNTCFLWLTRVNNPNDISIRSAIFAQLTAVSLPTRRACPVTSFPLKIAPSHGRSGPHLIHGSRGPPESSTQTASRSVQPFLQGSLLWQTDRHVIQADHASRFVTIGRIYVRSIVTRPKKK